MKTLVVKAMLVLVVILLSETAVYAHESHAELTPLQKGQVLGLTKAQITCSAVFIRAFPGESGIAEMGSEIISSAIDTFSSLEIEVSNEEIVELAQTGFDMWDGSSSEGRFDLMRLCGQDLLKTEAKKYNYMPPDTQIFM